MKYFGRLFWVRLFSFLIFLLLFFVNASLVESASPQGRIYSLTDYAVAGSAIDPDCPNDPIQVHVYVEGEPSGVVCYAAYNCPWGNDFCFGPSTGFWCVYKHPVSASSVPGKIGIALINKCKDGENVWLDPSSALNKKYVIFDREVNNVFVDKPSYKIGISKRFGASIVEFYNKRVDGSLNLVQSDPGTAFQAAIFGDSCHSVAPPPNCFGANDLLYNPTQAGSHCGHPNGSEILKCWADGVEVSCGNLPKYFSGKELKFNVRFKNFYYPLNPTPDYSYPYQDFDDVYGNVTYVFEESYVQVDWDVWKRRNTLYGKGWNQLPVAFLLQLTLFNYQKGDSMSILTGGLPESRGGDYFRPTWSDIIEPDSVHDGRWVTVLGSNESPDKGIRATAVPRDFLTLAFYNPPIKGACPPRHVQMNFLLNDGGAQNGVAVQNALEFEAEINHNMKSRSLIFPYRYDEYLPGKNKTLAQLANTYVFQGGFMPEWECNVADFDKNSAINFRDLKRALSSYGVLGKSPADLSLDGEVNTLDAGIMFVLVKKQMN